MKRGIPLLITCLLVAGSTAFAQSRSPVQYSRDGEDTIVQKDVNGERWAITYEIDDGDTIGNVLKPDGTSTFLDCKRLSVEGGIGRFACYTANGCEQGRCGSEAWTFLVETEIPLAFFFPGNQPQPGPSCRGTGESCDSDSQCCSGLECEDDATRSGVCLVDDGNTGPPSQCAGLGAACASDSNCCRGLECEDGGICKVD